MFKVDVQNGTLTRERARELAVLDKTCFTNEAWSEKDWLKHSPENFQSVFIYDGKLLVAALAWGWHPVPSTGYLYSFAVLPSHRGLGLGRQMLDLFLYQADHILQIHNLFAHTRASNESSQKLLMANNFTVNSYVSFYYDDEDAIEWKRQT